MAIGRRNFLGMLGAAVAAPLIPMVAPAAGYSRATYELAIGHAKRFPLVSVSGMSKRIGILAPQAEAIISEMSSEGIVGVINPTRPGTVRASSNIFTNDVWGIKKTSKPRPTEVASKAKSRQHKMQAKSATVDANIDLMLAHLRELSVSRGMTLHPRCFA
jgi:hypothetical protein